MRKPTLLSVCLAVALTGSDRVRPSLTNDDVVALLKAGFREGVIVQAIDSSDPRFDLSPDALASLRRAGAGETVIAAMSKADQDQQAHLRLLEPGVYVKKADAYALVAAEPISWRGTAFAARVGQTAIVRVSLLGRVDNRNSYLILNGLRELLVVCHPDQAASEYQLLRGEVKDEWREFHAEAALRNGELLGFSGADGTILPEVDNTFDLGVRLLLKSLPKGEYGLAPPGVIVAGRIAPNGKIYTFSVE